MTITELQNMRTAALERFSAALLEIEDTAVELAAVQDAVAMKPTTWPVNIAAVTPTTKNII